MNSVPYADDYSLRNVNRDGLDGADTFGDSPVFACCRPGLRGEKTGLDEGDTIRGVMGAACGVTGPICGVTGVTLPRLVSGVTLPIPVSGVILPILVSSSIS